MESTKNLSRNFIENSYTFNHISSFGTSYTYCFGLQRSHFTISGKRYEKIRHYNFQAQRTIANRITNELIFYPKIY